MIGGGRGGGGTAPHAAAEGAAIPTASKKLVQHLRVILADRSEAEIYATLLDCGMDPDVAVDRLISQDSFHEVRRKRDKKKETKASQESRVRPFYKSTYRGSKAGSDRSGRFYSGLGDSAGSVKGPIKKETDLHYPSSLSILDSVKSSNPAETISAAGNIVSNKSSIVLSPQADAKSTTFQPPSQVQHGWGGIPGRPSMADIVRMGKPQAKLGGRSVANSTGMAIVGGPVISKAPNSTSEDSQNTVLSSDVDHGTVDKLQNGAIQVNSVSKDDSSVGILSPVQDSDVPESFNAPSMSANPPESVAPDVNGGDVDKGTNLKETKEMNASNAKVLTSTGPFSASDIEIHSEYTQTATHPNYNLIDKTESNEDVSTTANEFEHLNVHEEKVSKSSEDNPAVIIPDHLQVSNADFAHLTFGSFVSGTLDGSLSMKPATCDGEVETVSEDHSIDQSDVRIHEYENKETVASRAHEYVDSAAHSNVKSLDITPVQEPEVRRPDIINVTNHTEYSLPSNSDYVTSTSVQPDSAARTYLQENRQMQDISPLSSFMQGNIPNGLLPPAIPPLRELDPAFSLLLTNPPLATMINGATSSSISNTMVSTQAQENVHPGGLSNPQLTQSQPSTSVAPGPPLPHHLALHPYAQATLPLGYASMIGYPSLPQSYAYLPPAAFQQPFMNNGIFHQPAAAVPNSSIKYPLPQYKTNAALANLPQPASLLSSYVGGFGAANTIPGNFALNQSTASPTTTLGFDGTVPSQYKDGNHFVSLQQSENPAMWMHGASARAMPPPLTTNTLYGYQGQGHQGGLRQGQLPSQFGAAIGQSQPGLGPEHRNPSDSNLSAAAAQANQMWPNSY